MSSSLLLTRCPRSRIILDITILADDGGRLYAVINVATCALIDAGLALKDFVCCCSTVLLGGAGSSGTDELQDAELMNFNQKEISTYQHESSAVYFRVRRCRRGTYDGFGYQNLGQNRVGARRKLVIVRVLPIYSFIFPYSVDGRLMCTHRLIRGSRTCPTIQV